MGNVRRLLIIVAVIVIFTACLGYYSYEKNKKGTFSTDALITMNIYKNIKALADASDVIIVGEVTKVNEPFVVADRDIEGDTDLAAKENFIQVYVTYIVYDVKIDKILKGSLKENETIEIMQTCGIADKNEIDLKYAGLYKKKYHYLYFLEYAEQKTAQDRKDFGNSKYIPLAFEDGEIKVKGNKIDIDEWEVPFLKNGTSLDDIEKMIQ